MRKEYMNKALDIVKMVFPTAAFLLDGDIEILHQGVNYGVRTSRYKHLDYHEIGEEQKADAVSNDIIKTLVAEITKAT